MAKIAVCRICGVPRHISKQIMWRDNGTMAQRRNPDHRSVFLESDNIDAVFRETGAMLGQSIEHIVTESRRRSAADYLEHFIPPAVKSLVRLVGLKPVIRRLTALSRILGYGDLELTSMRWRGEDDDYMALRVRDPYSMPLICGDVAGAVQVFDGRELLVAYEQRTPLEYDLLAHPTRRVRELQDRLEWKAYACKEGHVELSRCPDCGVPEALRRFDFNLEKGIILSEKGGRRMVGIGAAALEAVFDELERELGKDIPAVVVEAQRRFIIGGSYSCEEIESGSRLRSQLAVKGLGNLMEYELGEESMRCRIENACLPSFMAGTLLGYFELLYEKPGEVDYRLKEDDELLVVASPRA